MPEVHDGNVQPQSDRVKTASINSSIPAFDRNLPSPPPSPAIHNAGVRPVTEAAPTAQVTPAVSDTHEPPVVEEQSSQSQPVPPQPAQEAVQPQPVPPQPVQPEPAVELIQPKQVSQPQPKLQPKVQQPAAPKKTEAEPVSTKMDTDELEFESDIPKPKTDDTVDIENIVNDSEDDDGEVTFRNLDKQALAVPLSDLQTLAEYFRKIRDANPSLINDQLLDIGSDVRSIMDSIILLGSGGVDDYLEALKKVKPESLRTNIDGVTDTKAAVKSKFRDTDHITVEGNDAELVFSAMLSGGVRRFVLWNTGITISLRPLSLNQLHQFFTEINHTDDEYGRNLGAPYYMYSSLVISAYIIEHLLPQAICGSSYVKWNDTDALLNVISYQDYPTIVWALATMLYPDGIPVAYTCTEPDCGQVTREVIDLAKLHKINYDLVTPEMLEYVAKSGDRRRKVLDDDLARYRTLIPVNRKLSYQFGTEGSSKYRKWEFKMKEPSLADWVQVGREFLQEIRRSVSLRSLPEVSNLVAYNYFRIYKPWIESISLTMYSKGKPQTATVVNNGNDGNNNAIQSCLDELRADHRQAIDDLFQGYIHDSLISHICFHLDKCPHCGRTPVMSHHGYIPYDVERSFFILAGMKHRRVDSPTSAVLQG